MLLVRFCPILMNRAIAFVTDAKKHFVESTLSHNNFLKQYLSFSKSRCKLIRALHMYDVLSSFYACYIIECMPNVLPTRKRNDIYEILRQAEMH